MAEIIIVWILALIVIAIAWGVMERITSALKALAQKVFVQAVSALKRTACLEIAIACLLGTAVLSIMVTALEHMDRIPGLPALMIWAGGVWLVPFRLDEPGQYWLSALALGVILTLVLTRTKASSSTPTRTDGSIPQRQAPSQQGQETSTSLTGLGVLFWIFMIGLTVATLARYTGTANAVALNS